MIGWGTVSGDNSSIFKDCSAKMYICITIRIG